MIVGWIAHLHNGKETFQKSLEQYFSPQSKFMLIGSKAYNCVEKGADNWGENTEIRMKGWKWKLLVALGGWFFCRALPFRTPTKLLWNTLPILMRMWESVWTYYQTHPLKTVEMLGERKERENDSPNIGIYSSILPPKDWAWAKEPKETIALGCYSFAEWFRCHSQKKIQTNIKHSSLFLFQST